MRLEVERPRRPEGPGNLQAWARDTRYAAAAGLAEGVGASIATGHTADDQVETILYRLASSPSRRALLGMRPRDGRPVRPCRLTREQTTPTARSGDSRGATIRATPRPPTLAIAFATASSARSPMSTRPPRRTSCACGVAARRGRGSGRAGRRRARGLGRLAPQHDRARAACRVARGAAPSRSSSSSPTAPRAGRSPAPLATPRRSWPCAAPAPRCSTWAAVSERSPSAAPCVLNGR